MIVLLPPTCPIVTPTDVYLLVSRCVVLRWGTWSYFVVGLTAGLCCNNYSLSAYNVFVTTTCSHRQRYQLAVIFTNLESNFYDIPYPEVIFLKNLQWVAFMLVRLMSSHNAPPPPTPKLHHMAVCFQN